MNLFLGYWLICVIRAKHGEYHTRHVSDFLMTDLFAFSSSTKPGLSQVCICPFKQWTFYYLLWTLSLLRSRLNFTDRCGHPPHTWSLIHVWHIMYRRYYVYSFGAMWRSAGLIRTDSMLLTCLVQMAMSWAQFVFRLLADWEAGSAELYSTSVRRWRWNYVTLWTCTSMSYIDSTLLLTHDIPSHPHTLGHAGPTAIHHLIKQIAKSDADAVLSN